MTFGGHDLTAGVAARRLRATEPPDALTEQASPGGDDVLLGRAGELAELRAGLGRATAGRGGLFLLVGEPGIGKTRLADAFSSEAARAGADVLWGRCWEAGGAPSYWPWVEALRAYARGRDRARLAEQLGAGAAPLARILPAAQPLAAPAAAAALDALDPEQARFALFDAVVALLEAAAAERPVVLVLDDVHVADRSSLLLLRFVAARLRELRLLMLVTCRDADAERTEAARDAFAALARDGRTLPLRGLGEADVERMVARALPGGASPQGLAAAIHSAAGGNPFFAEELIRLLRAEGRLEVGALSANIPVPDSVREAIRRRLDGLGGETRRLLAAAAAIGGAFELDVLARVAGRTLAATAELLAPAVAARITLPPAAPRARHRFAHVLFRQVLYEELADGRRLALHERVGSAMERLPAARRIPAEVARHFLAALPAGDADRALDWATRAGEHAARGLAHEEAAAHYESALHALGLAAPADERRRCELLLALGAARQWAGDAPEARDAHARAAAVARAARDGESLARAALGYGEIVLLAGETDERLVALLREALAALPPDAGRLRVRVLGRLARELHFAPAPAPREREALSRDAVALARELGDPETLADALGARHVATWSPGTLEERLEATAEILRLSSDRRLRFDAHVWRASDLLEAGEVAGADMSMQSCRRMEQDAPSPAWSWQIAVYDAARALFDGRFDAAERCIERAAAVGARARGDTVRRYIAVQLIMLGRERGDLAALEATIRRGAEDRVDRRAWLAQLAAELGRVDETRAALAQVPVDAPTLHRGDMLELPELCGLVAPCALVRDAERAVAVYTRLLPHAERFHVRGVAGSCDGSVQHHLGVLATVLGRSEDAERHFRRALERNTQLGSPPLLARTQVAYAELLLARGAPGDAARAAGLLGPALSVARTLGMAPLQRRAEALSARAPADETDDGALRREGDVWAIAHGGAVVRVRDSKGLHHLARLLGEPGREVAALELARSAGASRPDAPAADDGLTTRSAADDHAGPLLDAEAKSAYRERLADLRAELDEADRWHDIERAAAARAEIDALTSALAAAVGLGGRDRPIAAGAERARMSVSKAIRTAIRNIGEHDAQLGDHLGKAVRTGTFCVYAPDPRAAIRWTVQDRDPST